LHLIFETGAESTGACLGRDFLPGFPPPHVMVAHQAVSMTTPVEALAYLVDSSSHAFRSASEK
jgi:hypothetical protein